MYETGAPPAPPPLPAGAALIGDGENPQPKAQLGRSTDSPAAVLPAGPPPGTRTYRLRGTETAQDG